MLIVLDEPTSGVDPNAREMLWNTVQTALAKRSFVLTTHLLEEANTYCDEVGMLISSQMRCIG